MATTTITVTVSQTRQPIKKKLEALADRLGCRVSDLVWYSITSMLAKPPSSVPTSGKTIGRASGFWVIHKLAKNKLVSIEIQEVKARSERTGRSFYRYKKDDAKGRTRALNQAKKDAAYDLEITGLRTPIKFSYLNKR